MILDARQVSAGRLARHLFIGIATGLLEACFMAAEIER
jgi:hypothetical protein